MSTTVAADARLAHDPLALAQALIACPSVTPAEAGALDLLERVLRPLGFVCTRLPFSEAGTPDVDNLYARWGTTAPNFCFAGHTDVVPPGDVAAWAEDPFSGVVRDGRLYGRGAADMKGAIACFVAAAAQAITQGGVNGSISLLITGDEEGPSINGTAKVLAWLASKGERLDGCVVGEPTNPHALGDMIKIGRRGSTNGTLTIEGKQGHIAYPHLAVNPTHPLVAMLAAILAEPLDAGTAHFQPSSLQISSIDVGNPATNVIPARATARFNIRFNDRHDTSGLEAWLRARFDRTIGEGARYELALKTSGQPFLTAPGALSDIVAHAVARHTGRTPELSTTGGTSDARFIRQTCPVVEFGLVGQTMHQVDEQVAVDDLVLLTAIYRDILGAFLTRP